MNRDDVINSACQRGRDTSRFWSKVKKTETCWLWTGRLCGRGYPIFDVYVKRSRHVRGHRFAWALSNGSSAGNLFVCHHCDNPACVRPDHLFLGTNDDNQADSVGKGRHVHGIRVKNHRLSNEKVVEIRRLAALGWKKSEIAKVYGVQRTTIRDAVNGRSWQHVKPIAASK